MRRAGSCAGSHTDLPLAAARQSAKELRAKIALGHDVAGEKQERKSTALARSEAARSVATVGQVADEYFERMNNGRWKHPNIVRSRIEKDIKPHLGKLALDAVEPRHIDAMLRASSSAARQPSPTTAALGEAHVRLRDQAPPGSLQPGRGLRPGRRRRHGTRPRAGAVTR